MNAPRATLEELRMAAQRAGLIMCKTRVDAKFLYSFHQRGSGKAGDPVVGAAWVDGLANPRDARIWLNGFLQGLRAYGPKRGAV